MAMGDVTVGLTLRLPVSSGQEIHARPAALAAEGFAA